LIHVFLTVNEFFVSMYLKKEKKKKKKKKKKKEEDWIFLKCEWKNIFMVVVDNNGDRDSSNGSYGENKGRQLKTKKFFWFQPLIYGVLNFESFI